MLHSHQFVLQLFILTHLNTSFVYVNAPLTAFVVRTSFTSMVGLELTDSPVQSTRLAGSPEMRGFTGPADGKFPSSCANEAYRSAIHALSIR